MPKIQLSRPALVLGNVSSIVQGIDTARFVIEVLSILLFNSIFRNFSRPGYKSTDKRPEKEEDVR